MAGIGLTYLFKFNYNILFIFTGAKCHGGNKIEIKPEYWRESYDSEVDVLIYINC